jgi:alpha-N-arabinofuranosidase
MSFFRPILYLALLSAALDVSAQALTLTDIGSGNPVPGTNDIYQFSTAGNQQLTGAFNYYTDNSSPPGQTFTMGTNSLVLTSLALRTGTAPLNSGGGGLGPQSYQLQIFQVTGSTANMIASYYSSSAFSYVDGDWLQWSGLSVGLSANQTYAYSFRRVNNGYDGLAVASGNTYSGGEAVLIPNNGGTLTYQSTHAFDAVFDLGFSPAPANGPINDDQIIYGERASLNNGWANWNYGSTLAFSNTAPVHSGNISISATMPGYSKIWFVHDPVDATLYDNFTFWVNGGASGGQHLQVAASTNWIDGTWVNIGPLQANTWQQITVPLAALGVAGATNLNNLWINNWGGGAQPVFYLDDIALTAKAPPATIHVGVNAAETIRTVDARLFGINTAVWDGYLNTPATINILTNMNNQALRWPGGSGADVYFMTNENSNSKTIDFIRVATNTHAQVFFTVNYGTGTPQQAADWVRYCNITNHCAFKYWEVGNESGGTWETDSNTVAPWQPHDPWTFAMRFKDYYNQMKAVDPTIKIGASADITEDGTANYNNHPVVNPRTGVTHNGWTPVMLHTMLTNGCIADFLIDHKYAPANGDTYSLLFSKTWATDAANLRQMLVDYLGTASTNVELNCTENGSEQDRQAVSLVGGLFWADSVGQILQTEINSRLVWDLRNGQSAISDSDNALYGWRTLGGDYFTDWGIVAGLGSTAASRYPTYYCGKLMKYFASGGDTVVSAASDSQWLSAYAVRQINGSLTLLIINKSCYMNLNAAISLNGYTSSGNATTYSYGIPQDQAAFFNGADAAQDISTGTLPVAGSNLTATFAPYSATVIQLSPAAPSLVSMPSPPSPGNFIFQLQGLPSVPYVIEMSTNLAAASWSPVVTNSSPSGLMNVTNLMSSGAQFYRAMWQH